jgi:DNA-binding YbaB/EbfC family protein
MAKQMKNTVVDASVGGGVVNVKMRGDFELLELKISPDLVKDGDVEMIQDLVTAAINEARRKVEEKLKSQIGGLLPPGLGF